jgi:hypothetical protein
VGGRPAKPPLTHAELYVVRHMLSSGESVEACAAKVSDMRGGGRLAVSERWLRRELHRVGVPYVVRGPPPAGCTCTDLDGLKVECEDCRKLRFRRNEGVAH